MDRLAEYSLFARRIGLVGVVQTLAGLKGVITLPILTRVLGASDYGVWALILVTVSLAHPLIQLGLGNAVLRFLPAKGKTEIVRGVVTALSVIVFTGAVAGLVFFFASDLFARAFLNDGAAITAIRVAALLLMLDSLAGVALGAFRVFGQIKRYAAVMLLQTVLEVGLIAFFVLSGYGLMGAVVALLITRAVTIAVALALIFSYAGFARPDFSLLPSYLKYGLPLVPHALFAYVVASSDRYVIGGFLDAAQVGIYAAAYSIGNIVLMFSAQIRYVLRPTMYKGYDEGRVDEVKTYLSYSWKLFLLLSVPSAFGLSVLAGPLLASLTTPEFIAAGRLIVPLVAGSMVVHGAGNLLQGVILLSKRSMVFLIIYGVAAAVNLGLNLLLVPRWGVVVAAVTTLIAYAVATSIMYWQARKHLRFGLDPRFIAKSVGASAVMALAVWAFNPVGVIQILLAIVMGAAVYVAVLLVVKGITKGELQFFRQLVRDTVRGILNGR